MPNKSVIKSTLGSPASQQAYIFLLTPNVFSAVSTRLIRFHYMPESISESKSSIWKPVDILGRSEPIRFYSSSGIRKIDLTLMFHVREAGIVLSDTNLNDNTIGPLVPDHENDIEINVRFLRSLVYPDYSDSARAAFTPAPPPVVLLKIGDWLFMRSIVTNVIVDRHGPWSLPALFPNRVEVKISFEEFNVKPYDGNEVFNGSDNVTERELQGITKGVPVVKAPPGVLDTLISKIEAGAGTLSQAAQNALDTVKSKFAITSLNSP